jgi:AcrR family transcriptional regulator
MNKPAVSKKRSSSRATTEPKKNESGSREEILMVATEEFATNGLSGSRVDEIADRTRTSKRMIYYHFGSKEGLYRAVLENAYAEIRTLESQLDLARLSPVEAMQRIVELTFDYDENHPMFVRLVMVENIHRARTLEKLSSVRKRNASIILSLNSILERGREQGLFRVDVTALDLHLLISALCFFRASNRHTFSTIFDCNLSEPALRVHHRQMMVEAVLRFLEARPAARAAATKRAR